MDATGWLGCDNRRVRPRPVQALRRGRLTLRRGLGRGLAGLREARYLRKWIPLGIAIGIVAGLGALAFYSALQATTHYVLGALGGYHVPTTAGEGGVHPGSGPFHAWTLPLVVAGGGLLSGLLVFWLAPEAEGHGTDAAINTVHHNPKGVRPRVAAVKTVASALMIGSGGSGGREGPTAQISSSFGSLLARTLNLTPADARVAVSSGMAAGIAAIFRAPLGGALLGVELLYREDIEAAALVPSLVASIVSFTVFGLVEGFSPIFGYHLSSVFESPEHLVWFVVLGLVGGLFGRLYAATFHTVSGLWRRVRVSRYAKPAIGGLCTGLIALAVPGVLGTGYGAVQQTLIRESLLGTSLWLVLALPFAKILATSMSIGSGGSGGIFGPGMVIGGAGGAALWRVLEPVAPWLPHSPVPFVIVGMAACFGSIAHAPLAVMLMVAEMTGNLSMLAPAMIAVALATVVAGNATIYRSQPRNRASSPAHRFAFGLPAMAAVPVSEVMTSPRLVFAASTPTSAVRTALEDAHLPGAPVVNKAGTFIGSVQAHETEHTDGNHPVGQHANPQAMTLASDATLDAAAEALAASRGGWVPVLDSDMAVVGILAGPDLVRGYRLALRHSLRRVNRTASGQLLEVRVAPGSAAAGRRIADVDLPARAVILGVHRQDGLVFASGETQLSAGDVLSVVARDDERDRLLSVFGEPPTRLAADDL